jgi:putative phosphoribosyl transferase
MKFRDRIDAGNLLAERLVENGYTPAIVLGIPRGGVILADIVAKKLAADFDIVIPRKLGAPENEELAIGAVMEDGTSYRKCAANTTGLYRRRKGTSGRRNQAQIYSI